MVNRWTGVGRLGKDVELRYTTSGKAVASFTNRTQEAESRVRELEISNASLIGVVDGLIIETRKMQAQTAVLRDLLRRLEKLERVAEAARKTTVLVIDDEEGVVQTVHYACGCFVLAEEDAEPPQTKCPHCELIDALVALDGDTDGR